jgi:RimJ/RimL family protein N-acetyltransferase
VTCPAAGLRLARPTAADIPFIMVCERIEGYEELVGRSEESWHRHALASDLYRYFLAYRDDLPTGFAILRGWDAPEQVAHIKRIAVVEPGRGFGKAFLNLIMDSVFRDTRTYRLSLGLFPENLRARRAYEGVGFKAEGISRGSAYFNGVNRDELVMAVLRPDWLALRATLTPPGPSPPAAPNNSSHKESPRR